MSLFKRLGLQISKGGKRFLGGANVPHPPKINPGLYVTGSEKTDHFLIMQFVQYGPKALPRS